MKKFISYLRVSTAKQGESGLGLEAQQAAVAAYVQGKGEVIAEYREIESGKVKARPQLRAAIAACRSQGAVLVVAKLDRLARNVAFTSALMDSGVDFVATDNPNATRLTIHILAAVAEDEYLRISARTKAALAAKKARGEVWAQGASTETLNRGRAANQAKAAECRAAVYKLCRELRDAGRSLPSIAAELNGKGFRTRRDLPWTAVGVYRVLDGQTGGASGRF